VARHLGTEHTEERCDEPTMLAVIDRLPAMFDEPFADSSAIPTYVVSSVARQQVTVALSGDGGDELFVGYPRYRHYGDVARVLQRLPRPLAMVAAAAARRSPARRTRRIADVLDNYDPDPYARFVTWLPNPVVERLTGEASPDAPLYREVSAKTEGLALELRAALLDLVSYLPDDILVKVDRASMAVSLEVRAPLLDHRVVELALRLPLNLKRRGNTMKWLLRQLLYKKVPRTLVDRPKMGFGVPLDAWFRGPLRERMSDYCSGHDFEDLGLAPEPIREMWRRFGERDSSVRPDLLWQALMLVAWHRSGTAKSRPLTSAVEKSCESHPRLT
jgi:asparagine synthase (glutamine-hydrolysing)